MPVDSTVNVCMSCAVVVDERTPGALLSDELEMVNAVTDFVDVLPAYARVDWSNVSAEKTRNGGFSAACPCCGVDDPVRTVPVLYAVAYTPRNGATFILEDPWNEYTLEVNVELFNKVATAVTGWLAHKGHDDFVDRAKSLNGKRRRTLMEKIALAGIAVDITPETEDD